MSAEVKTALHPGSPEAIAARAAARAAGEVAELWEPYSAPARPAFEIRYLWHTPVQRAFLLDAAIVGADQLSARSKRPCSVYLEGQHMYTSIAGYWSAACEFTEAWANSRPQMEPPPPKRFQTLHAWVTVWLLLDEASQEPGDPERLRRVSTAIDAATVIKEMDRRYPATAGGPRNTSEFTGKDTGKDAVSLYLETSRVFQLYASLKSMDKWVSVDGANGGTRTHTARMPLEPKSK